VSVSWQAYRLTLTAEVAVVMAVAEAVVMAAAVVATLAVGRVLAVVASAADMEVAGMVMTYSELTMTAMDISTATAPAMAVTQPMDTVRVSTGPMGGRIAA
jgi:hypothetical protein